MTAQSKHDAKLRRILKPQTVLLTLDGYCIRVPADKKAAIGGLMNIGYTVVEENEPNDLHESTEVDERDGE